MGPFRPHKKTPKTRGMENRILGDGNKAETTLSDAARQGCSLDTKASTVRVLEVSEPPTGGRRDYP